MGFLWSRGSRTVICWLKGTQNQCAVTSRGNNQVDAQAALPAQWALFTAYGTLSLCPQSEPVHSPCSVRTHTMSRSPTEGKAVVRIQTVLSDLFLSLDLSEETCTAVAHGHGALFIWRLLHVILLSTCMVLHQRKVSLRVCCLLQWNFSCFSCWWVLFKCLSPGQNSYCSTFP